MKNEGKITAFSKGLYSNWFYHKPTRTLFDCGEGFATYFGNFSYGIERICLSHGHGDHILGLPSLIGCRNSGRGDKEKPLEIYYPVTNYGINDLISFVSKRNKFLNYQVKWIPIQEDTEIPLNNKTFIKSFRMEHQRNALTLGYNICENRYRLKPEYVGKNIPELLKNGMTHDDFSEIYVKKILSYCLDSYRFDPDNIKDSELAIMDCTFLDGKDRDDSTHFSLLEAMETATDANVKAVICAHFSGRYYPEQIIEAVRTLPKVLKDKNIYWVTPGEIYSHD